MANLASLFAVPLALVAEDVKENQKSHQVLTHIEPNRIESNTESGCIRPAEGEVPATTGEIKLNCDQREVAGNKTSPKKKKKKKQNKRMQVHGYVDYDKKAAEEAQVSDSSMLMWSEASSSAARNHECEPNSSSSHREVISYEELLHPKTLRKNSLGKGQQQPGQERSNNKNNSTSENVLQPVVCRSEAPRPNNVGSIIKAENIQQPPIPSTNDSTDLSIASSVTKVREYVDYDKKLAEDAKMDDQYLSGWIGAAAASTARNHDNGVKPSISCQQREIISYEELSHPRNFKGRSNGTRGIRGHQFHSGLQNPNNGRLAGAFKRLSDSGGLPNKIPRMTGSEMNVVRRRDVPMPIRNISSCFIDPMVAASEKQELFERPQPLVNPNERKPLSNKQRKKIEKAKFYKEKLRQQLEKEKDRISIQKLLQCRFFSYGNCTKGEDCLFSHDFVPHKKPELCKFYVMSFCEKGANCIYYHNDWPCKFFHVYRSCSLGDACRFSHQPLTDETRPLLEKSVNEGLQNGSPSSKPSEANQPTYGSDVSAEGMINGNPRILGENAPMLTPFCGQHVFTHSQPVTGQLPPGYSDSGFDAIHFEPWNKKLELVDLDERHRPQLPSGVESSDHTFMQDPRLERYRMMGKLSDRSESVTLGPGSLLDVDESVANGFDRDGCDDSKFSASCCQLQQSHCSFASDSIQSFSSGGDAFSVAGGALIRLASSDATEKLKEPFSLPHSSSSLTSVLHTSSEIDNTRSEDLRTKSARHFSLPLVHRAIQGSGDKKINQNKATMQTTSAGPSSSKTRFI